MLVDVLDVPEEKGEEISEGYTHVIAQPGD